MWLAQRAELRARTSDDNDKSDDDMKRGNDGNKWIDYMRNDEKERVKCSKEVQRPTNYHEDWASTPYAAHVTKFFCLC